MLAHVGVRLFVYIVLIRDVVLQGLQPPLCYPVLSFMDLLVCHRSFARCA